MNFSIEQSTFLGFYSGNNLLKGLHNNYGKPFNSTLIEDVELLNVRDLIVTTDINLYTNVLGKGTSYSLISVRELLHGTKLSFLGSIPCNCIITLNGVNPSFEVIEEYLERLFDLVYVPRGFVRDFDEILDFEKNYFVIIVKEKN